MNNASAVTSPQAYWVDPTPSGTNHLGPFDSTAQACSSVSGSITGSGNFVGAITTSGNSGGFHVSTGTQTTDICTAPTYGSFYILKGNFCSGTAPSGFSPTATCPVCPTGYTDQSGTCVKTVCPATGTIKTSGIYLLGPNPEATIPNIACDGNCTTTYSGQGVTKRAMVNGVYQYYFGEGNYAYNGESCSTGMPSPSSTTVPPNTCNPATQDQGQVNGVTVCIDKQKTDSTNSTTSPPVSNPDGSTTTTTTTTKQNESDNTQTTTTTQTTTATDGTVTQQTTSTTQPLEPTDGFCAANPTHPTCLKNSDACEKNPETLGCATLGEVADTTVGTQEQGISSITPKTIGGAGSCPAPINTSFMGQALSFTFDLPCQAAAMLKPLILALAWLASAVIFIGGVRQ